MSLQQEARDLLLDYELRGVWPNENWTERTLAVLRKVASAPIDRIDYGDIPVVFEQLRAGEHVPIEREDERPISDLMAALQASLDAVKRRETSA